jgi:5-methylcytosine-specific restriction protein A
MPQRAKSICRKPGCSTLIDAPGYCQRHTTEIDSRINFRELDNRKTDEQKKFYSSREWTSASLAHRQSEPLCRRCRADGKIVAADMVHHNPSREELIKRGLNPLDDKYLESLCNNCHLAELRRKRK